MCVWKSSKSSEEENTQNFKNILMHFDAFWFNPIFWVCTFTDLQHIEIVQIRASRLNFNVKTITKRTRAN